MEQLQSHRPTWFKRLGWLAIIWVASVGALAIVAMIFRWIMNSAGLTS